jgi:GT2 family glycosyltransferase/glycosyltransferase involved in cell wall biosynthesis
VLVVCVLFDSTEVLPELLSSLPAGLEGLDWDLVFVDNASRDGSAALARTLAPWATVVESPRNGGYAAGINAGVAAHPAHHTAVLVLNPDVRLAPGCGRSLLAALRETGAGIAVPVLRDERGHLLHSLRRDPTVLRQAADTFIGARTAGRIGTLGELVATRSSYRSRHVVDWAEGAALLIDAGCLAATGGWDESYFLYSEETDFALRARDLGYATVFEPAAGAVHLRGASSTDPALWALLCRNRVHAFRRRHGLGSSGLYYSLVVLREATRAGLGRPTSQAALRFLLNPVRMRQRPGPWSLQPTPTERVAQATPGTVIFSAQDYWYHNRAHSDVQLARALSADRPVLLVNSLGMRMPRRGTSTKPIRRILRKVASSSRGVRRPEGNHPQLVVMTPISIPAFAHPRVRRWNALSVRWQVQAVARLNRMGRPDVIITLPTAWDAARQLPARTRVVNRSDRFSSLPEADTELIADMERQMLEACDVAVYVSPELMADERSLVEAAAGRVELLGHGLDVEHFRAGRFAPEPADLAPIPHPRVGFFGGFDDYVIDLDLIKQVAVRLPDVSVVLVGDAATCSMEELTALPNVHWLGMKPYEEIPAYGAGFDVALMPWLQNEWIRFCNPIKTKEYLALGLPVVSTYYPAAESHREVLGLAHTQEEFVRLVRAAVDGKSTGTAESRRQSVEGDSWASRAAVLRDLFETGPRR